MPRRRRGAKAAARGSATPSAALLMRMLLHSPKDLVAGLLAFAAVSAIVANALFLQAGRHPSPMFGTVTTMPAPALSLPVRCRVRARPRLRADRPIGAAGTESWPRPRSADPRASRSQERPMTSLVKATRGTAPQRPPTSRGRRRRFRAPRGRDDPPTGPAASPRVQRALTEYGYGQLKPTGTVGADTQAAIQKFERDAQTPGDRADVRSPGEGTHRDDRPSDRLARVA